MQLAPEIQILLGNAKVMGANDFIQMMMQGGALQFQHQAFMVRIGDQGTLFAQRF